MAPTLPTYADPSYVALPTYADPSYVALRSPLEAPLHFLGLELAVAVCFALTLRHALGHYRKGDRHPLFQWIVIFVYGLMMELLAFNYYQNYDHGQFTVQLYHRKLPLYVTAVYLVFHYTGLKTIERLRLSWLPEALLVGFAICMLDVPFDTMGPDARWWVWSATDQNLAVRWLGVPVTSYYWYMLFGGILAALCRALKSRVEKRSIAVFVAVAPLVGLAVIVLGVVGFIPFHVLKARGVPDGAIVAGHMVLCAGVALASRSQAATPAAVEVRIVTTVLQVFHLSVLALLWSRGGLQDAGSKLAMVAAAACASMTLVWGLPVRRAAVIAASPAAP